MNKNAWMFWAICVICWTILAILFNEWWITLFSFLCLSSIEIKSSYYRICDRRGKHSEYAETYNKALAKAQEAGWVHCLNEDIDYCPNCK